MGDWAEVYTHNSSSVIPDAEQYVDVIVGTQDLSTLIGRIQ